MPLRLILGKKRFLFAELYTQRTTQPWTKEKMEHLVAYSVLNGSGQPHLSPM